MVFGTWDLNFGACEILGYGFQDMIFKTWDPNFGTWISHRGFTGHPLVMFISSSSSISSLISKGKKNYFLLDVNRDYVLYFLLDPICSRVYFYSLSQNNDKRIKSFNKN
jgi:hypothetical protein